MSTAWTDTDSAELTATLIVLGNARLSAAGLDEQELRATLALAHRMQVPRSVIAERIGWSKNHLWKWASDHECAWPERGFPTERLAWLTRAYARAILAPPVDPRPKAGKLGREDHRGFADGRGGMR
jgi:hypothetical protein